jgi:hypothetical protein
MHTTSHTSSKPATMATTTAAAAMAAATAATAATAASERRWRQRKRRTKRTGHEATKDLVVHPNFLRGWIAATATAAARRRSGELNDPMLSNENGDSFWHES